MNYLAPSILAADFSRLGEDVRLAVDAGADMLHLDVMDGKFVPSISFGMPVIASLRRCSKTLFDVHLMIEDPGRYIADFVKAGADSITVHAEACLHLDRTVAQIRDCGVKAGVALNPATPLNVLEYVLDQLDMVLLMTVNPGFGGQKYIPYCTGKIKALREEMMRRGLQTDIQVDGGIQHQNTAEIIKAGANVLVAGSSVFQGDITKNVTVFKQIMTELN